jgi:hypothetical protein
VLAPATSCADQQRMIAAQAAQIAELRRRLGTPGFTPPWAWAGTVTCCGRSGSADETCGSLRRVNAAQAARIVQLEAELRACTLTGGLCRTHVACGRLHAAMAHAVGCLLCYSRTRHSAAPNLVARGLLSAPLSL